MSKRVSKAYLALLFLKCFDLHLFICTWKSYMGVSIPIYRAGNRCSEKFTDWPKDWLPLHDTTEAIYFIVKLGWQVWQNYLKQSWLKISNHVEWHFWVIQVEGSSMQGSSSWDTSQGQIPGAGTEAEVVRGDCGSSLLIASIFLKERGSEPESWEWGRRCWRAWGERRGVGRTRSRTAWWGDSSPQDPLAF